MLPVKITEKGYLALAASMLLVAQAQATELLNSSYDVSRELFAALNPPFEAAVGERQWRGRADHQAVACRFIQAGAGYFAGPEGGRGHLQNQVTDLQILHDKGNLIRGRLASRLPNNSSPFYSTMGFWCVKAIRKNIHDWNDLVRSGRQADLPEPENLG